MDQKVIMKYLIISFLFILPLQALTATIRVGCTTKCDIFFKYALKKAASRIGHKVVMLDMSKEYPTINWQNYDAVIVPGGADINPSYYLDYVEDDLKEYTKSLDHLVKYSEEGRRRDPIEFSIIKEYFSREDLKDIPVLGVCRGMQLLAVSQGIPLYVDIKTELGIRNRRYLFDRIFTGEKDSLMMELFPYSFWAFKRHHQGIRVDYYQKNIKRWPQLKLTAFSNRDLIAEAIEFKERPVLGVQFHPENDFGFESARIFNWLLSYAIHEDNLKNEK